MNTGLSLRIAMEERELSNNKLAKDLGVSLVTLGKLRKEKRMSGKNLAMLSEYFGISASEFIKKGE